MMVAQVVNYNHYRAGLWLITQYENISEWNHHNYSEHYELLLLWLYVYIGDKKPLAV